MCFDAVNSGAVVAWSEAETRGAGSAFGVATTRSTADAANRRAQRPATREVGRISVVRPSVGSGGRAGAAR